MLFSKGQALGNDYLVVERSALAALGWPVPGTWVERLCDRHTGAGSDGVLVVEPARSPIRLRIYNPDGSEAEKSGNGLRILGAWLYRHGHVRREPFQVELATDTVVMTVEAENDDGSLDISVDMGPARFLADEAGVELPLDGGESVTVHPVSLGNPHCVVIEPRLERERFLRIGPQLERHDWFERGSNIQFAEAGDADDRLRAWIWERGVGETLASGSSASAVAAVGRRLGLVSADTVTVEMRGGSVSVRVDEEYRLRLRGPARIVYEGAVVEEQVREWGR